MNGPAGRQTVTVVIPAYDEAGRVGEVVTRARAYADEVLVIDDASRDGTAAEASAAGARVVTQPENRGYIAAIKRGFTEARGDVVVLVDADGEVPVERIPDLVAPILAGEADMVQGHRGVVPRASERVLTWLASRRAPVGDSGTGSRAVRTDLARRLTLDGACICGIFTLEVLSLGGRVVEVPITLRAVAKPRRIAWFHLRQLWHLLPWLTRRYPRA